MKRSYWNSYGCPSLTTSPLKWKIVDVETPDTAVGRVPVKATCRFGGAVGDVVQLQGAMKY